MKFSIRIAPNLFICKADFKKKFPGGSRLLKDPSPRRGTSEAPSPKPPPHSPPSATRSTVRAFGAEFVPHQYYLASAASEVNTAFYFAMVRVIIWNYLPIHRHIKSEIQLHIFKTRYSSFWHLHNLKFV
jgi:hypothetical protein